jgi:hypothetical protein
MGEKKSLKLVFELNRHSVVEAREGKPYTEDAKFKGVYIILSDQPISTVVADPKDSASVVHDPAPPSLTIHLPRIHLTILFPSPQRSKWIFFQTCFYTSIIHEFLFLPILSTCPAHRRLPHFANLTTLCDL